jgi:predicted dehydrogenase
VTQVQAVYGAFSDMGMESPDSIEMLLRFEDRLAANVHLDFYQHPRRRQMELMGVKGTIIVEFASWDKATLSWYNTDTRAWTVEEYKTARNDMFRDEDAEFLLAILGQRPLTCTIDEACKSLGAVAQVYQIPEKYLQ